MINRQQAIEAALAGWRAAERKVAGANGDTEAVQAEIERHRGEFQRLSAEHMIDRIDAPQGCGASTRIRDSLYASFSPSRAGRESDRGRDLGKRPRER